MKVSLTITDERVVSEQYGRNVKTEEYERVNVTSSSVSAAVLAGILRAVADDLTGGKR